MPTIVGRCIGLPLVPRRLSEVRCPEDVTIRSNADLKRENLIVIRILMRFPTMPAAE
jgi:hypothetical protein